MQRRPTKQASYELCNHAKAYLEGAQYASGYDFLYSLLAAGTSISTPAQPYIGFLAPPTYLAFASSLVVYPRATTKTHSKDAKKGSDAALRYLRCVHSTIDGPAYPTIRQAFRFPEEYSRRRARNHRSAATSLSPRAADDVQHLAGDAANAESLWAQAEDFWQLIGWAFNCSILHKKRWDRWKPWLGIMLDFLEADWNFCQRRSKDEVDRDVILQESLLWHYIIGHTATVNRATRRRIVKAVYANASPESLKDFTEVWEKETEGPKRRKEDEQFGKVDFETGDMGGYDEDEEMHDVEEEPTDDKGSDEDCDEEGLRGAIEQLGGADAIGLRQRLIALLTEVALSLPDEFTTTSDFFDNVLEDFIRLPSTTFKVLISTSKLSGLPHVAFCANLLLPLVSGKLPSFLYYEPTQQQLETNLLTLKGTAQSFAMNFKISLILEQIFMYMMNQETVKATDALREAMEQGIEARQGVHGTGKGRKGNAKEELQARALLEACSERLLGMLEMLEMKEGKPAQPSNVTSTDAPSFLSFGTGSPLSDAPSTETDGDD
ncbi:hypothetical protein SNOG_14435 [Parastagonospora nodorum SN15]|nr:hypothetical protein SNOG_14435 [Parastagonospora nodorum SN15]EAT78306.2 hypothetical protein SNOG_14435 [Parastagonospora nodorum SN15]